MGKFIVVLLTAVVAACVVFFAGCSPKEPDYSGHSIIGSWRYYQSDDINLCGYYYTSDSITFEKDGTGTEWIRKGLTLTNTGQYCLGLGSISGHRYNGSFNFKIEKDTLKIESSMQSALFESNTNYRMRFSGNLDTLFLENNYVLTKYK